MSYTLRVWNKIGRRVVAGSKAIGFTDGGSALFDSSQTYDPSCGPAKKEEKIHLKREFKTACESLTVTVVVTGWGEQVKILVRDGDQQWGGVIVPSYGTYILLQRTGEHLGRELVFTLGDIRERVGLIIDFLTGTTLQNGRTVTAAAEPILNKRRKR